MANMNEIKDRISGIKDIMKITNAMYLISSSKLKKARANWEAMQPYFDNIQATVHHVLEHTEEFSHPYFDNGKSTDISSSAAIRECADRITTIS